MTIATILSLVPRRISANGTILSSSSRCAVIPNRCYSAIATAAARAPAKSASNDVTYTRHHAGVASASTPGHFITSNHRSLVSSNNTQLNHVRYFSSKYMSVDHSAAYRDAMSSSHGTQLQLALEEGRGKDDAPFDPFSQFLDEMGSTNDLDDDEYDDEGDEEDIEEAQYSYKTIENYDDENKNTTTGLQVNDDDDVDESEDEKNFSGNTNRRSSDNPTYTTTGALYRPKSERLALRAGYPAGGNFAVISLAGFQHKVTVDDLLVVNKLKPISAWSVGSTHTIKDSDILLLANQDKTLVGLPGVAGGEVDVMVEEITRDKTLIIFKKRRRKNSRRKNGFRRQVTFLRVLDVRMPGEVQADSSTMEDVKVAA
ncbi:hypothetical protein ACHAWU_008805 [Discostella pseudostelligera]|uniref:Large ribosomal subunit protein bL21m n=1 Tax=Discostella pseudostelligera TaxID=259834 RepID=A0ABD3MZU0_9STRA